MSWAWLGSKHLSDLRKGTTRPKWAGEGSPFKIHLLKCSGQLAGQPGTGHSSLGFPEASTWRQV